MPIGKSVCVTIDNNVRIMFALVCIMRKTQTAGQRDGFSVFNSSIGVKFVKCLDLKEAISMALL